MRQYEGNDFRESRLKREMVSIRVVSDRGFNCTLKKQTAMRITAIDCNTDYDNFGSLIFFYIVIIIIRIMTLVSAVAVLKCVFIILMFKLIN